MNELISWIHTQIQTNQFFNAAAFASIAAGVFAYMKDVPKNLINRIEILISYKATIYQTDELYDHITSWIKDNHRSKARNVEYSTRFVDPDIIRISGSAEPEKGVKDIKEIPVEDFFYLRKYKRFLRISFGREKLENASTLKSVYLKHYTFKGLFASKAIRRLLNEINHHYANAKKDPKFYISKGYYFSHMQNITGKPLSQVVLNSELKQSIVDDITMWTESKDEYVRRGIAHKRGYCFYGPPGTGKTTLARAIAIEYQMDVYNVNLNNIDGDDDMLSMFSEIAPNSILLFEDIDAYFNKRTALNKHSKVTFSGLLNALDGAVNLNDILIVFTTNHIDKLDPALIRPGRIDVIKELGFAGTSEINEYLRMFYLNDKIQLPFELTTAMCNVQNACLANPDNPDKVINILKK